MKVPFLFVLLVFAHTTVSSAFGVLKPSRALVGASFISRPSSSTSLFGATATSRDEKTPIHLLAGFLGAGKTTTLKNLLENTEHLKIGVIVNDVASINIDAKLVNNQENMNGVLELQNGCACCSLADELLVSLDNLLDSGKFDAIVVELSGVADPVAIQNNWKRAIQSDKKVTQCASLRNVVTLVDACTFGNDYLTWDVARDRWVGANNRQIAELLAEQVEAANLIILNKEDIASPQELEVAEKMCKSLNEDATLLTTSFGKVSALKILELASTGSGDSSVEEDVVAETGHSHSHDHACEDPDCTDTSHSHSHDHACDDPDCTDKSHSHSHEHAETNVDSLGISNFVYKATRPFHPERLSQILFAWPIPNKDKLDLRNFTYEDNGETSPFVGVVRSKGFCWLAPANWAGMLSDAWRHNQVMYWSHAGKHLGVQPGGQWWASLDDEAMRDFFGDNVKEYERVKREDFVSDEWGDRRQELVFIGVDLQEDKIRKALDDCLLDDNEMKEYREELDKFEQEMKRLEEEARQREEGRGDAGEREEQKTVQTYLPP